MIWKLGQYSVRRERLARKCWKHWACDLIIFRLNGLAARVDETLLYPVPGCASSKFCKTFHCAFENSEVVFLRRLLSSDAIKTVSSDREEIWIFAAISKVWFGDTHSISPTILSSSKHLSDPLVGTDYALPVVSCSFVVSPKELRIPFSTIACVFVLNLIE